MPTTAARRCRRRWPPTRSTSRPTSPPSACSPAARVTGTGSCSTSTRCRRPISTCACRPRSVTVGPTKLGRTAFGANLRGGALALSVGEAQIYGGMAKGSFGIARSDAIADVKAQFQFTDVDLQACASEMFGVTKLSGRGNLNVSLVASGSSPFGLAQSLDGTATLTGHDGAISGFNVEQLLKRLERRPLSGGGNFRNGSTPYDSLTVAVKFADGIATAEDVRIEGPAARV